METAAASDSMPRTSFCMTLPKPHHPPPFLSLLDASFRLGDRLVFEHSTWIFRRSEHWAILGANGSGKSLLAEALRGRLPLVGGELLYQFRPLPGLAPEEAISHVSFEHRKAENLDAVVQSRWNSLDDENALRVRDFLSYERVMEVNPFEVSAQHLHARPRFESRMRRAVALLRVGPFLDRRLISLSNGERQRVQLARGLSRPMRLLILDEAFARLDAGTRARFHVVLERLMETPLRILLIATRPEDLPRQVTHVLCVAECRIVAAGSRADILSLPHCRRPVCLSKTAGLRKGMDRPARSTPARAGAEVVRLRNATVRYGDITVLHDVNWIVRAGESWALLGPNGSGKTTLLSLIIGDNPQVYANDITVFGQPRGRGESVWEIRRPIGWVSPELHLHFTDSVTCFEVVASGLYDAIGLFERPSSRQRAAVRRWLVRFHLLECASEPLFALSAGLQRMVLLARALVKCPRLLILDEPCQGLDSAHRRFFVNTVDGLIRSRATTVIYVTHRPDEIPPSINRVFRLNPRQ